MKEYPIDHNVLAAPIAHALLIGRPTYHQWCRTGALFGPVPVLSCRLNWQASRNPQDTQQDHGSPFLKNSSAQDTQRVGVA